MRTQYHKIQIEIQLVENKIVKNKIRAKVKNQISAPTGRISIGLQRHKAPEQKIEVVDKFGKGGFHVFNCGQS